MNIRRILSIIALSIIALFLIWKSCNDKTPPNEREKNQTSIIFDLGVQNVKESSPGKYDIVYSWEIISGQNQDSVSISYRPSIVAITAQGEQYTLDPRSDSVNGRNFSFTNINLNDIGETEALPLTLLMSLNAADSNNSDAETYIFRDTVDTVQFYNGIGTVDIILYRTGESSKLNTICEGDDTCSFIAFEEKSIDNNIKVSDITTAYLYPITEARACLCSETVDPNNRVELLNCLNRIQDKRLYSLPFESFEICADETTE